MNHPAADAHARQVADTCRALVASPGLPFADHLPPEQIHHAFAALGGAFRRRIYTPAVTLLTFLHQVLDPDHSCQAAVDRLLAFRVATGLGPCSADTGACCKARARLPEDLLRQLTRRTGRALMGTGEGQWLWKGRHVKVVAASGRERRAPFHLERSRFCCYPFGTFPPRPRLLRRRCEIRQIAARREERPER